MDFPLEDDEYLVFSSLGPQREQLRELAKRITTENLKNSAIIETLTQFFLYNLSERMSKTMRLSLERTFGVDISKLVNINYRFARIKWDINDYLEVSVELTKKGLINATLSIDEKWKTESEKTLGASKIFDILRTARKRKNVHLAKLYAEIWRLLVPRETRKCWRGRPYYIPAGRGGLIESYETVVQGLVSLSPVAPVRGLSMPPMPGMAAQFYSVMLKLKNQRGPLNKIVSNAFKQMLRGEIQLRKSKGQPKSRLVYKFSLGKKTGETDLIHAASMIKELTPIYFIVKELVKQGDYLLIEEPESHLHPGAQIKMANVIGDIAYNKVKVLITSHSDIMLRAVGHMLGRMNKKSQKPLLRISAAIYWLKEGETGCTSELLKLSKKGIIKDIPSFDEVVKELYETELNLETEDIKGEQISQETLPVPFKA
jgi:predicted ATPase